jgi:hypothetical protein
MEALMKVMFLDIDGVLNTERLRDRYVPNELEPGRVRLRSCRCWVRRWRHPSTNPGGAPSTSTVPYSLSASQYGTTSSNWLK